MRELSSGIYNTLKSGSRVRHGITARDFLGKPKYNFPVG